MLSENVKLGQHYVGVVGFSVKINKGSLRGDFTVAMLCDLCVKGVSVFSSLPLSLPLEEGIDHMVF